MQEFVVLLDKMLIISYSNFSAWNDKYGIVHQSYFNVHSRITVMQQTSKSVGIQGKRQTSWGLSSWEGKIWYWLLHAWAFPANLWPRWWPSLKNNVLITPVKHTHTQNSAVFHREIVLINNYVSCFSLKHFQYRLHCLNKKWAKFGCWCFCFKL